MSRINQLRNVNIFPYVQEFSTIPLSIIFTTTAILSWGRDGLSTFIFLQGFFLIIFGIIVESSQNIYLSGLCEDRKTLSSALIKSVLILLSIFSFLTACINTYNIVYREFQLSLYLISLLLSIPAYFYYGLYIGYLRDLGGHSWAIFFGKMLPILTYLSVFYGVSVSMIGNGLYVVLQAGMLFPIIALLWVAIFRNNFRLVVVAKKSFKESALIILPSIIPIVSVQAIFMLPYLLGQYDISILKIASQFIGLAALTPLVLYFIKIPHLIKKYKKNELYLSEYSRISLHALIFYVLGYISILPLIFLYLDIFEIKMDTVQLIFYTFLYFLMGIFRFIFGPSRVLLNLSKKSGYIAKYESIGFLSALFFTFFLYYTLDFGNYIIIVLLLMYTLVHSLTKYYFFTKVTPKLRTY